MTILTIAANDLRRLLRQPSNLFFLFFLPLLLILVLGSTIATYEPRLGVVTGNDATSLSDEFVESLRANGGAKVTQYNELDEAVELLQREELTAIIVLPDSYGDTLISGGSATVEFVSLPGSSGFEQQGLATAVIAEQNSVLRAARFVSAEADVTFADATSITSEVARSAPGTSVAVLDADGRAFADAEGFSTVAAQELVLFLFLTGMIAAAALIQSRNLGVTRRMLATPASATEVLGGLVLGRFGTSALQGIVIALSTTLLFGANWGSWLASLSVIAVFSLVATAVAVLIGSLLRNENQATAAGLVVGLSFAAIGGCMVPLEVFSDTLRTVAHITPHAWAIDAFTEIIQRGGGITDVATELGVLLGYAIVLLLAATFVMRRAETS